MPRVGRPLGCYKSRVYSVLAFLFFFSIRPLSRLAFGMYNMCVDEWEKHDCAIGKVMSQLGYACGFLLIPKTAPRCICSVQSSGISLRRRRASV